VAAHEEIVFSLGAVGDEERVLEQGAKRVTAFLDGEGFGFLAKAGEAGAFGGATGNGRGGRGGWRCRAWRVLHGVRGDWLAAGL